MSKALTEAQIWVLKWLAPRAFGTSVWMLGRNTCEALRKRGLVQSSSGDRPIHRYDGNPIVTITDAGRRAISSNLELTAEKEGEGDE